MPVRVFDGGASPIGSRAGRRSVASHLFLWAAHGIIPLAFESNSVAVQHAATFPAIGPVPPPSGPSCARAATGQVERGRA